MTGRAPATVLALSGLGGRPGLEGLRVLGLYGLQEFDASTGRVTTTVDEATLAAVAAVREALPGILAGAADGVHLEDKDISLVVHTRPAADPQRALDDLTPAVQELAAAHGLRFEPGRFAAEVRPDGSDKGTSLLRLVGASGTSEVDSSGTSEPGSGSASGGETTAVLYAGDDTGDLPALQVIPGLRARGIAAVGVAVVQDGTDPDVLAAADLTVDGPQGVLELLASLADRIAGHLSGST